MNKIKFISEIASTHNGSEKYLKKLLDEILKGKADFVKFQIYKNENLCHRSSKLFKGLKKIELKQKIWKKIINYTLKKKNVILEPFDEESYVFCKYFKKKTMLKISSSEHDNLEMIEDALKKFKKVYLNISGFDKKEINLLTKKFKEFTNKLVLMYGFQSFPSKANDLRLNLIKKLANKKNIEVGYADHSLTDDEAQTYILTGKAIDYGAQYIEKHITLKRSEKKPDYISSFEPSTFNKYVDFFKKEYVSNFKSKISLNEKKYCNVMGKFAFAKTDISKGEKISYEKIKFLRTSFKGISRLEIRKILKKKKKTLKKKLKKDELFKKKYLR